MATGRVPTTANSPLTAKGDLFTYSTAPARLAVGNNGEQIVADSSTSSGLRYQSNFAAGKNKIINGDFGIWQRGTSFTPAAGVGFFSADRFQGSWAGTGTSTFSQQTFSPGTAPVAGYEGTFYLRCAMSSGATYLQVNQSIEDVRTFAGQTITVSYWAKASSSVVIRPIYRQGFGSGGSANVDAAGPTDKTLTSSWVRYTDTVTMPSIAGKTIGTGSALQIYFLNYQSGTIASNTIEVWGLQVEASNTPTAFQTATGTIQGETSACQRYFSKSYSLATAPGTASTAVGIVSYSNTSTASAGDYGQIRFPVAMRIAPTVTTWGYGGTSGTISQDSNGVDQAAGSGSVKYIGENGCTIYNNSGGTVTTSAGAVLHFRADAEL